MSDNFDDFADIIHSSFGIAEGAGLDSAIEDIDSAKSAPMPDGMAFDFRCPGCGRNRRLTLDYQEVIALAHGISPHIAYYGRTDLCQNPSEWRYIRDENAWGLKMQCNRCHQFHYPLRIGPREPQQYLDKAMKQQFLNPAAAPMYARHCQAVKQQRAQQRR